MTIRSHTAVSAQSAFRPGSLERFFNNRGEINAGSKEEAAKTLLTLLNQVNTGEVSMYSETEIAAAEKDRRSFIEAASAAIRGSASSDAAIELASSVGATLTEVLTREGFMRKMLEKADLVQGNYPRIKVRNMDVVAISITRDGMISPNFIQNKYFNPGEFAVVARPMISQMEINAGTGTEIEDLFIAAQTQMLVEEDRKYLSLARRAASMTAGGNMIIAGGLNPVMFATMYTKIMGGVLTPANAVVGTGILKDILVTAAGYGNQFDPVSQYEVIRTGRIASIMGVSLITDGYRRLQQRVLNPGEIIMTAAPEMHGGFTDRGPVEATPLDGSLIGSPSKGWFCSEYLSMAITNVNSLIIGHSL